MNLGDFTVTDVKVTSADNSTFKIEGSISATDTNNTKITGTISGTVTNSEANITFTFKPGAMPIDITAQFKGKK